MWQTTLSYNHRFGVNSNTFRHRRMHKGVTSPYCRSSSTSRCIIYRSHSSHMERCASHKEAITSTLFYFKVSLPQSSPNYFPKCLCAAFTERKYICAFYSQFCRSSEKKQSGFFFKFQSQFTGIFSPRKCRKYASLYGYAEQNDNQGDA